MIQILRRKKFYVIYPEYFDKNLSRSQGRKVSLSLADDTPHIKKIAKACKVLEIDYEAQLDKSHPTKWWENNGRVLIPIDKENKIPKKQFLDKIAEKSRKYRLKQKQKPVEKPEEDKTKAEKYGTKRNVSARRPGKKRKVKPKILKKKPKKK